MVNPIMTVLYYTDYALPEYLFVAMVFIQAAFILLDTVVLVVSMRKIYVFLKDQPLL